MSNAWLIATIVTLAGHGGLAAWLGEREPAAREVAAPKVMRFQVIPPAPAKKKVETPEPPEPPPIPPPPKLVKRARPRARPPEPPKPDGPTSTELVEPVESGLAPDQSAPQGELAIQAGGGIDGAIQQGDGTEKTRVPEPAPEKPQPRPAKKYVPIFEVTRMPRAVQPVQPEVPDSFRSAGREAVVVIEVAISARGDVVEARVVRKAGFGLDAAALAAARKTRFEPALIGDRPVAVRMQIPYRFKVRQ